MKKLGKGFPKPSEVICQKWQLASEAGQTHMICMPGISKEVIDRVIKEILREHYDQTRLPAEETVHF